MRVLLVEDEPDLADALRTALERNGIVVDLAGRLDEAAAFIASYTHDAVILDRQLPDGDGIALIRRLRAEGQTVPVLVLTARGDIADRVEGLDQGADDYLGKPFAMEELLARLRALFRRPGELQAHIVTIGPLQIDFGNHGASVDGRALDLTRREILVLEALARRVDRMVARAVLMEAVFAADEEVLPNALDTQVSRLRRKLAAAEAGVAINGVRGVGYMLREAE